MPMQLNAEQRAILANPDRLRDLAVWVIASSSNHYAQVLCQRLRVKQGNHPSDRDINAVRGWLRGQESDVGIVVRLINTFRQDRTRR